MVSGRQPVRVATGPGNSLFPPGGFSIVTDEDEMELRHDDSPIKTRGACRVGINNGDRVATSVGVQERKPIGRT